MMEPIYEQSKDLHIRNFVAFGKAADSKLYKESTFTTQIKEAELQEMFKKGMLLINTGEEAFAVAVCVNGEKAYTVAASTSVAVTEWSALAAE